jgi:hypothetical protein
LANDRRTQNAALLKISLRKSQEGFNAGCGAQAGLMAAYRNGPINHRRRSMHKCPETGKKRNMNAHLRARNLFVPLLMTLSTRLKWALLGAAMLAGTCHAAAGTKELRSFAPGVDVVYEVQPTLDFRAFLGAQPPGSVSAIALFEPPSKVAVVARVKLTAPAVGPALQLTTVFRLANGTVVPQNWRIENVLPGRHDYRAIFGLPHDVLTATTTR